MENHKQTMQQIVEHYTFEIYKNTRDFNAVIREMYSDDDKFSRLLQIIVAYGFAEQVLNLKFYTGESFDAKYQEIQDDIDDRTFIPVERFLPALEVLLDGIGIEYTPSAGTGTSCVYNQPQAGTGTKANYDEREFRINDGVLMRYRGTGGSVVVPDFVKSINKSAFAECKQVISVVIPESVTSLGVGVFEDCSNLASVTLPDNLTTIPEGTFGNCGQLSSIKLPTCLTSIQKNAFRDCGILSSVKFPASVTSIGDFAFTRCFGLTSVSMPASCLSTIGFAAFKDCANLKTISIPASVATIGNSAFVGCGSISIDTKIEIKRRNAQAIDLPKTGNSSYGGVR